MGGLLGPDRVASTASVVIAVAALGVCLVGIRERRPVLVTSAVPEAALTSGEIAVPAQPAAAQSAEAPGTRASVWAWFVPGWHRWRLLQGVYGLVAAGYTYTVGSLEHCAGELRWFAACPLFTGLANLALITAASSPRWGHALHRTARALIAAAFAILCFGLYITLTG